MNKELFINKNGICHYKEDIEELPKEEVELCEKWIKEFTRKNVCINYNFSSYGLKHVVENHFGKYVSNGSFIKAALNLGFNIKSNGQLNANFNLHYNETKEILTWGGKQNEL